MNRIETMIEALRDEMRDRPRHPTEYENGGRYIQHERPERKVYEFDATVSTHSWLERGVPEVGLVRVWVAAKDPLDAELLAGQMAAVVGEVTGTYPRI